MSCRITSKTEIHFKIKFELNLFNGFPIVAIENGLETDAILFNSIINSRLNRKNVQMKNYSFFPSTN